MPVDVVDLGVHKQRYALLTNSQGGILDDLMITRREATSLLIVNAACKEADTRYLVTHLGQRCTVVPIPSVRAGAAGPQGGEGAGAAERRRGQADLLTGGCSGWPGPTALSLARLHR